MKFCSLLLMTAIALIKKPDQLYFPRATNRHYNKQQVVVVKPCRKKKSTNNHDQIHM